MSAANTKMIAIVVVGAMAGVAQMMVWRIGRASDRQRTEDLIVWALSCASIVWIMYLAASN